MMKVFKFPTSTIHNVCLVHGCGKAATHGLVTDGYEWTEVVYCYSHAMNRCEQFNRLTKGESK